MVKVNRLGASWEVTSVLVRLLGSFLQRMIVLVGHRMELNRGSNLTEKPF